jgi:hypothetical protein
MFIRALRTAIENGADGETAMTRAMVIATQAHVLSRAVAQGVRPVRPERIHHPPNTLSSAAKVEYIAAEIHRLSGIKPPLEPSVLAVALGKRLVPAFDSAASKAETKRQELLGWKPTAQVDGNNLVINGVLKVQAWQERKDADLTEHVLQAAQKVIHNTPDHEVPSSFIAFLKGNGDVVIAMPTELGMETVEDWVRPALRDLARRICATAIYVVSDGSIAVCGPRGRRERRTITVDVENIQEDPPKRTYVASTGDDGTLGAWSEDSTCARFSDLLS